VNVRYLNARVHKNQLSKYKHAVYSVQHCPYSPEPRKHGADAQSPVPIDDLQKFTDNEIKKVQEVIGSILNYARAVNVTVLMALSTITSDKPRGQKTQWKRFTKSLITWQPTPMQQYDFKNPTW
jgi:hypothetical protein